MERVRTLIEKLQQQIAENVSADKLLVTVQMLQIELQKQKSSDTFINKGKVAVMMPASANNNYSQQTSAKQTDEQVPPEEKIIEVLQVDEKEIEEELEEIKRNAEAKKQMSSHTNPVLKMYQH
jgi:hypothetical protein